MTQGDIDRLTRTAANLWNTTPDQIRGQPGRKPSRQPNAVTARAALCWTLGLHTRLTTRQIADALNLHQTTVLRNLTHPDIHTDPRTRDLEQELLWPNPDPSENN